MARKVLSHAYDKKLGEGMAQLKFISREKLVEYLDEELQQFLNNRGLFEINQYGWLADGELDPDYCGHAMWQEKPPELKKLLVLGEEFTMLMRSSRHSLGLTFLFTDATDSPLSDSGFSASFYFADTVNKLNLSSDRIREFLITAFAHRSPNKENWIHAGKIAREEKVYDTFRAPFQCIFNEVSTWSNCPPSLLHNLSTILPLAENLAVRRSKNRNPVRHLTLFQERFSTAVNNLAMGYPDEALSDNQSNPKSSTSQDLVDWYNSLVEISNLVFMAEYLYRRQNQQADNATSTHTKARS